ncbi:MAG: tetratricopeptide repeat protein [Crocinitomicaceae bacterium]
MEENKHFQLGVAKVNENDFKGAIIHFTQAIEEDDKNPFHYNQRAVCYLNLHQFELSMFDMNKSIELDDHYAYFFSCRGFLKTKLKDMEGAIQDYERSLELDPENEITYNNMGLALESMGNMTRAQKYFKRGNSILGYDPENREMAEDGKVMQEKQEVKVEKPEPEQPSKLGAHVKEVQAENSEQVKKEKKKIAKEVFTKKSVFKEFIGFIANGFKLKEDDQEGKS